jgi:hypothetical protein
MFQSGLVAILSAGWLLPLWFAIDNYLHFWQDPGVAMLMNHVPDFQGAGGGPPILLMEARFYFAVSLIWLGVSVAGWSFVAASRLLRGSRGVPSGAA